MAGSAAGVWRLEECAQAISKWENGHALLETILLPLLAKLFKCSIDFILMPFAARDSNFQDLCVPLAVNMANSQQSSIKDLKTDSISQ